MVVLVWVFGVYLVVAGVIMIISPNAIRHSGRWFKTSLRTRLSSLISAVLGAALFLGRHSTSLPVLVGIIGLITVFGSLTYVVLPWRAIERIYGWALRMSDNGMRIYGVVSVVLGAILIASLFTG
jgi:uncharacterized membrane protein HdeD (DUF308 family)